MNTWEGTLAERNAALMDSKTGGGRCRKAVLVACVSMAVAGVHLGERPLPLAAMAGPAVAPQLPPWRPTERSGEAPEEEPDMPPQPAVEEQSIIEGLSRRLWEDRGLRKARVQRAGSTAVFQRVERAMRAMAEGDDREALDWLRGAVRQARTHNHQQTLMTHQVLGQLADRHIARGDFASAALVYREMLQLGRYLPTGYTATTLNQLINTHFDLGDYETALMYVRIGIAVLDNVGVDPYLAMNRIIQEMSALEDPIADLEYDFDAAMARLEAAAAKAQAQGLVIEDQWWAPVYFARHDRERAITLLKDLLRPELGDALREAAAESPVPAQTLSP
ncbi:MAG: hypothetical protein OXG82_00670 [Gammaproteobacteria bacterium]|nr:hypothetical protein [Gammaproteobacteria bacterium]